MKLEHFPIFIGCWIGAGLVPISLISIGIKGEIATMVGITLLFAGVIIPLILSHLGDKK